MPSLYILQYCVHSFIFSLSFFTMTRNQYRTEKESRLLRKNVSLISYLINIARVRVSTKEKQGDDHHITKTSDDDAHTCHGVACQKVWSTHIHVYTYTNIPHTPRSKSKTRIHALMTRKRPLFTHLLTYTSTNVDGRGLCAKKYRIESVHSIIRIACMRSCVRHFF